MQNDYRTYLHSLPGRLRIKLWKVKGSPRNARKVERELASLAGVEEVSANPLTGNVLIHYTEPLTDEDRLMQALSQSGWLPSVAELYRHLFARDLAASRSGPKQVGEKVLSTLFGTAAERLILALI